MKAVFDYDVLAKIKTTIVSYLMIKELCVVKFTEEGRLTDSDIVDISHMYSKDIEHLEENIEKLAEIFEINDVFKVEEIINNATKENVKEVKYTYSNRYFMTLVFVITEQNEYLIPFMSQEINNIKNGTLYKVSDFFEHMSNIYNEEYVMEYLKENGGVPYKIDNYSKTHIYGFVLAIIVLFSSLIGVNILKREEVELEYEN